MNQRTFMRIVIALVSITGLIAVFIFQNFDVTATFAEVKPVHRFILNRTFRFLMNDAFAIGLIYALFVEKKYVIFSLWIQVLGIFVFLIPYFLLKLYYPSYNGPLISYLHRLILNPILLLLLIPAFYYQKKLKKSAE